MTLSNPTTPEVPTDETQSVWVYYETDDETHWECVRLFSTKAKAEAFQRQRNRFGYVTVLPIF